MALVAILGLAGLSTVAAQERGGEWEPLAAGESRWVSFEYLGDGSQIEIRMYVDAVDNAAFSVWTPEQLRLLAAGAFHLDAAEHRIQHATHFVCFRRVTAAQQPLHQSGHQFLP